MGINPLTSQQVRQLNEKKINTVPNFGIKRISCLWRCFRYYIGTRLYVHTVTFCTFLFVSSRKNRCKHRYPTIVWTGRQNETETREKKDENVFWKRSKTFRYSEHNIWWVSSCGHCPRFQRIAVIGDFHRDLVLRCDFVLLKDVKELMTLWWCYEWFHKLEHL